MKRAVVVAEREIAPGVVLTLMGDGVELPHAAVCSICRAEVDRARQARERVDEMPRPSWEDD